MACMFTKYLSAFCHEDEYSLRLSPRRRWPEVPNALGRSAWQPTTHITIETARPAESQSDPDNEGQCVGDLSRANSNVQRNAFTTKNQFTSTIHRRVRSPYVPSSPHITSFKKRMALRHLCLLSGDYPCLAGNNEQSILNHPVEGLKANNQIYLKKCNCICMYCGCNPKYCLMIRLPSVESLLKNTNKIVRPHTTPPFDDEFTIK